MLFTAFTTLFGIMIKINIFYSRSPNMYYYIFSSTFLLSSTLAVESSFVMLFGTICPDHINNSFWSAGMLSGLGDTFGRAIGNADITVFSRVDGRRALSFWLYVFDFSIYFFFFLVSIVAY